MTLYIELKHGRIQMKADDAKKLAKFIKNAGDVEIRLAGRCIIIDDQPGLDLTVKTKGNKRVRNRNTTKRR